MLAAARRGIDFTAVMAISILILPAAGYAQSTATLFGRVFDPAGAVVPGARITMKNVATGEERRTDSGQQGSYEIAALPAGTYRLEVQADGFRTQVAESISVEVGRIAAQDFRLQ